MNLKGGGTGKEPPIFVATGEKEQNVTCKISNFAGGGKSKLLFTMTNCYYKLACTLLRLF